MLLVSIVKLLQLGPGLHNRDQRTRPLERVAGAVYPPRICDELLPTGPSCLRTVEGPYPRLVPILTQRDSLDTRVDPLGIFRLGISDLVLLVDDPPNHVRVGHWG